MEERELGFRSVIREKFPRISVLEYLDGMEDDARNYDICCRVLREHKDLVGIYGIGSGYSGIAKAISEAGKTRHIMFVGHELTVETRQLLLREVMDAVIDHGTYEHVERAFLACLRYFHIVEAEADHLIPVKVFFAENLPPILA
jgi:LacI family transcriptional regulator